MNLRAAAQLVTSLSNGSISQFLGVYFGNLVSRLHPPWYPCSSWGYILQGWNP